MLTPNTYVVTGTMSDDHTVALDEPLPIKEGKVRLVVEAIEASQRSHAEVMAAIRQRQASRGYIPPTKQEVDAAIQAERDAWEE
jgi:hypothetical protein